MCLKNTADALTLKNSETVNDLVVKFSKSSEHAPSCSFCSLRPPHYSYSLRNTKEPTFISTEKALMKREADLSRDGVGLFLQQFVQMGMFKLRRIPLWMGSKTCHSIEPWGQSMVHIAFLALGTDRKRRKRISRKRQEYAYDREAERLEVFADITVWLRKPSYKTHHIV